ncbi:protein ACCELERATED CELL DEATH 6-like [Cornus florida]|uniref:protein ACCELERATED CELL DEATH 6-like n=1 Tax=Cornus florida TaxID=4283 RepID=UPI00289A9102|nr:protein ACCELERATED CELL DEATH 6-like [Cornus florida]
MKIFNGITSQNENFKGITYDLTVKVFRINLYDSLILTILQYCSFQIDQRTNLQVAKVGCRNKFKLEKRKEPNLDLTRLAETHLIVATLIATVTFAAGFTIPGAYDGDQGPKQGTAVLTRQTAFQLFVMTDTCAMVCSVSAAILHLFASFYDDWDKRARHYAIAFFLIIAAMGAMVVAFVTGFCTVLEFSSAAMVCVSCSLFFPIFYYVFKKWCSGKRH